MRDLEIERTLGSILEPSESYRNIRTVLLAGGVGGARMAQGLAQAVQPDNLTIVVNVGDDATIYGALVCADLDTVTYTLAGIHGPEGWGIAGDTHVVMGHLEAFGVDTSFRLGDRDLAHCLARTAHLDSGGTLADFTATATKTLGIEATILPASNDPIRTKIEAAAGEVLDFQDYFVVRGQTDQVKGLQYRGADVALPAPGVIAAVDAADIVVIAPSNPPLSIWPMLAMSDLAVAVRNRPTVVAVSPLIGGAAVKGPLVAVMEGLGMEPSTRGVAAAYEGLLSHLVVDTIDANDISLDIGVEVVAADTMIKEPSAAASLARTILDLAAPHATPTKQSGP